MKTPSIKGEHNSAQVAEFEARKQSHIDHALDVKNQALGLSGLESIHLYHDALPNFDFIDIGFESFRFGETCAKPFFVAGMTAGHDGAFSINETIAKACLKNNWAMGVGSQRRQLLEKNANSEIQFWTELTRKFPGLELIANIGISQLIQMTVEDAQTLVDSIHAKALVVHANALQEVIQFEGTPQFEGAVDALQGVSEKLKIPVILKETGCGFSKKTLHKIKNLPLAAIDVSGLGGTHWGRVEGARADQSSYQAEAAKIFEAWGESTADSVIAAKEILSVETEVWASGGVRSGLDAAKLIALGATQVGYAKPALSAALNGFEALDAWMRSQEFQLATALFCTGCRTPKELKDAGSEIWKKI